VFDTRRDKDSDLRYYTPCSGTKWYIRFAVFFSQFRRNFVKLLLSICKWKCQLTVIWFWQNWLNIFCGMCNDIITVVCRFSTCCITLIGYVSELSADCKRCVFSKHIVPKFSAFSNASFSVFIVWCKRWRIL